MSEALFPDYQRLSSEAFKGLDFVPAYFDYTLVTSTIETEHFHQTNDVL